jgi:hypothetical protein
VRTGDQQNGRRPFNRPLEPDEDGQSHSSEGPRWEIAQVDRDDLEATAPHQGIGRRPGQTEPTTAADPEQPLKIHADSDGRGRVEAVGHVDEGGQSPSGGRRGQAREEQTGPAGGPRADEFRDPPPGEASAEDRVQGDEATRHRTSGLPEVGTDEERG